MLHRSVASKPFALVRPAGVGVNNPLNISFVRAGNERGTTRAVSSKCALTSRSANGSLVGLTRLRRRSLKRERCVESGRLVVAPAAGAGEESGAGNQANGMDSSERPVKMKTVVEHVALFSMPADLAQDSEDDMLSHLYSLQYHYPHLLAISLGRIIAKRPVGYSHALFTRFPSRPALDGFLSHPSLAAVMDEYVTPTCMDSLSLSYEAQVESDIEAVFRRGDSFESGMEHVVLLKAKPAAAEAERDAMVQALSALPLSIGPEILVQLTAGANFAADSAKGFTHGLVSRFPSEAALDAYNKHPSHRQVLRQHVLPLSEAILAFDYRVDPVGHKGLG